MSGQKKGKESSSFKNRVGEKHITNKGYEIEIIDYIGAQNCTVQFKNGYIAKNVWYKSIINGQVKNPYHKSTCGVGYLGEGKYKTAVKRVLTKRTIVWSSMFERSYDLKYQEKHPTYKGCSVDERWHNFQIFAEWFDENYVEGFELDKDILIKGNKIYSPETCCFVPQEINMLFTKRQNHRGKYPIGVSRKNKTGGYQAIFNKITLGTFNTIEEAFQAYKVAKEDYIKEVADKWRGQITEECYWAMINYIVEITD